MRILRSVAAIVAGFGFMVLTVIVGTIVGTTLFIPGGMRAASSGQPSALPIAYLAVNLLIGAIGAVLGGWLAARFAAFAPYGHAAVLAAVVAALSVQSVVAGPAGAQPGWYPVATGLIGVGGILLGGKLRAAAATTDGHVVA
ncbi:MAG: hypothetical protein ABI818_13810 [Acidobacteriota bacterium]